VWVRAESGKQMPIDPMPNPRGNIVAVAAGDGGARARVLNTSMQADPAYAGRDLFMPHAATCPELAGRRARGDKRLSTVHPQATGGSSGHEEGQ
jgi:hypothetical protein